MLVWQSISFAAVKGVCILGLLLECAKSKGRIDGRGAIPMSHKNGEKKLLKSVEIDPL